MTPDPEPLGWTREARDVLERACDHHGGLETWRAVQLIRLFPERLSGLVPWLKGHGQTFPTPTAFEIRPHERVARFLSYPDAEHVGVFEDGAVRLERSDGTGASVVSAQQRASFRGWSKYRRWSALDALYFFGYALTHYHSLPFTLAEARLIHAKVTGSPGQQESELLVELPAGLPTHCRRQRFYFDRAGRLTRHDYHAEILGFWARGAHFWRRQARFSGFPISLERHVTARLFTIASPITALHASFLGAELELRPAPSSTEAR